MAAIPILDGRDYLCQLRNNIMNHSFYPRLPFALQQGVVSYQPLDNTTLPEFYLAIWHHLEKMKTFVETQK